MRVTVHSRDSLAVERRPTPKAVARLVNSLAEEPFDARRVARLLLWLRRARPKLLKETQRRKELHKFAKSLVDRVIDL